MELNASGLNEVGLNESGGGGGVASRLMSAFASTYSIRPLIRAGFTSPYGSLRIRAGLEAPYAVKLTALFEGVYRAKIAAAALVSSYSYAQPVRSSLESPFGILGTDPVRGALAAPYGLKVSQSLAAPYESRQRVTASLEGVFDYTAPVRAALDAAYALQALSRVQRIMRGLYDLSSDSPIYAETSAPYAMIGGDRVALLRSELSCDEGSPYWSCTLTLAHVTDYQKFTKDAPFSVHVYGDTYQFILDTKGLTRNKPGEVGMTVSGLSPCMVFDTPRAPQVSRTWEQPVMARAACEALLGQTITWEVPDWLIPGYRLAVSNASPLYIVQLIARAVGGTLESNPDGSLVVRSLFPVSTDRYGSAPADQVLTDEADNITAREGVVYAAQYDKFYVTDATAEQSLRDSLEFIADDTDRSKGVLRVHPTPWRTNLVVTSTRDNVLLLPMGTVTREEEEVIEITGGSGTVKYPVLSLVSYEWLDRDLGGLTFVPGTTGVTSASTEHRYGLLRIRYRVRALEYSTEYAESGAVQYLVEEI
jgi:hypothetical protein